MAAVTRPMWSLLFRTKASLEKTLAVERCRREIAEEQLAETRTRLAQVELQHARLIDATLLKQGVINAPIRTEPAPPAHPMFGALAALSMSEYDPGKKSNGALSPPLSAPSMPDE